MAINTARPHKTEHFARVPTIDIQRSKFDLSHGYKTTLDGGYLVPIMVQDMLPGDTWSCRATQLCRMTTPIVPFMDNLRVSYFFFAVPKRLVWDNFEDFITGSHKGKLGTTHTTLPTTLIHDSKFTGSGNKWSSGSIFDYMGIPPPAEGKSLEINALPLRAYNLIYNEWFRDENLCPEAYIDFGDSESPSALYMLQKRGKRKDYFTSALPFVQKGPDVMLPLGGYAPVVGDGKALGLTDFANDFGTFLNNTYNSVSVDKSLYGAAVGTDHTGVVPGHNRAIGLTVNPEKSGVRADLSSATAATINSLREAFAVQHLLERDARNGTRYVESLLGHFRVQSPDYRLQRPEYIGGGRVEFAVNSIAQTKPAGTGILACCPSPMLAASA